MAEINGNISRVGTSYSVTLTVDSDFDRKTIWAAISHEDSLAKWLGQISEPILTGRTFTVTYPNDQDYSITAKVHERRVPTTLVFDWKFNELPENRVRLSLSKRPEGGTEVRVVVTGLTAEDAAVAAATWHTQMEFLRNYLYTGETLSHALRFRRDELVPNYEAQLESLGAPRTARRGVRALHPERRREVRRVIHTHAYLA